MDQDLNDFYITLHSSASKSIYPENSARSFTNIMRKRIDLQDPYEVALIEFTYPNEILNVYNDSSSAHNKINNRHITQRCFLADGYYGDIDKVLKIMNKDLENVWTFTLDHKKVVAKGKDKDHSLRLSPTLAKQLGFCNELVLSAGPIKADIEPNMHFGFPSQANIHCNIIPHQIYGDRYDKVLRSVTLDHSTFTYGGQTCKNFHWLMYVPVTVKELSEISIHITSGSFELFPFSGGTSSVLLHFRKTCQ